MRARPFLAITTIVCYPHTLVRIDIPTNTLYCRGVPHRFFEKMVDIRVLFKLYIIKIKIPSSCEIEDFTETHLCKLCVILRSRVLRVVCPH